MKTYLGVFFLAIPVSVFATCSSPISRTAFSPGTAISSTAVNSQLNTVYNKVNDLNGDCVTDATIAKAKLAAGYKDISVTAISSASYTALSTDEVISANAGSNAITVNLPTAVGIAGRVYTIKKNDSTTNTVTVDANSAETIDGALTKVLSLQWESMTLVSTGAAWLSTNLLVNSRVSTPGVAAPVFYSALIATTGTVSSEKGDFINGNCTNAAPQVCTFNSSIFTVAPNCFIGNSTNAGAAFYACFLDTEASTSSVSVRCSNSAQADVTTSRDKKIFCHGN